MKTLKYTAIGMSALLALALASACGDDSAQTTTTGTPDDGGEGGNDGNGGGSSGTQSTTNTGATMSTTGANTTGTNTTTGGDCVPGPEDNEAACSDGCSNDDDTFVDCEDFDCDETAACKTPGLPAENSNVTCSDGMDNDGDDKIDCDDMDCAERAACNGYEIRGESAGGDAEDLCTDGVDNDDSGFADCADFSCTDNWNAVSCQDLPRERRSNALCSDGLDNDEDGLVDCDDPGCAYNGVPAEGIVVCGPGPVPPPSEWAELANAMCDDGINNDVSMQNTYVDCADFGCTENPEITICGAENNDELCADGMDNDGDGFVDCAAFSCQIQGVTVCPNAENTFANCTDGDDNDGNGHTDCDDNACRNNPAACGAGFQDED